MSTIALVDAGLGNLDSVARALEICGARPLLARSAAQLEVAAAIVLPGVGAFRAGMDALDALDLVEPLTRAVQQRSVPFLGICLGMQLVATTGTEGGARAGLGWLTASVEKLVPEARERLPHVGWNSVHVTQQSPVLPADVDGRDFYFTHSYVVRPAQTDAVLATTPYGGGFASAVACGPRAFGVQFHPEKSQRAGQVVLRAFLQMVRG